MVASPGENASPPVGRRARKKALTRATIADAALRLFLERGFDQVTVTEVADAADVSPATVFNHFPTKEALCFDEDTEREQALIDAVRHRAPGVGVLDALEEFLDPGGPTSDGAEHLRDLAAFMGLVRETPALRAYADRMWSRHEAALAGALAQEYGTDPDDPAIRAVAHLVLETRSLAHTPGVDPHRALAAAFDVLRHGWREPSTGPADDRS